MAAAAVESAVYIDEIAGIVENMISPTKALNNSARAALENNILSQINSGAGPLAAATYAIDQFFGVRNSSPPISQRVVDRMNQIQQEMNQGIRAQPGTPQQQEISRFANNYGGSGGVQSSSRNPYSLPTQTQEQKEIENIAHNLGNVNPIEPNDTLVDIPPDDEEKQPLTGIRNRSG